MLLSSCNGTTTGGQNTDDCKCEFSEWVFPEGTKCLETAVAELKCNDCGKVLETKEQKKQHNKRFSPQNKQKNSHRIRYNRNGNSKHKMHAKKSSCQQWNS